MPIKLKADLSQIKLKPRIQSEQIMLIMGQTMKVVIEQRNKRGVNVDGERYGPYNKAYAKWKAGKSKTRKRAVRVKGGWHNLTGAMLGDLYIIDLGEKSVLLGFSQIANDRKAKWTNSLIPRWGAVRRWFEIASNEFDFIAEQVIVQADRKNLIDFV